jgi:hypothetical protein
MEPQLAQGGGAESGRPFEGRFEQRSPARRTSWRAAARPPTPANTSRIAPENGDPNGDPIRHQKRSQRVTRHPTGLVGPDVTNRQAQREISAFGGRKKWWTGGELNSRHRDFQSRALLSHHVGERGPEEGAKGSFGFGVSSSARVARVAGDANLCRDLHDARRRPRSIEYLGRGEATHDPQVGKRGDSVTL